MNRRLVRTLLGGVSFAALSCPASAADMAVKAPPPAPPLVYSWAGFYGGLHAGGGWAVQGDGTAMVQDFLGDIFTQNVPLKPFPFGGAQIGYNWQLWNRWVAGLEADISAGTHTDSSGQIVMVAGPPGTDSITAKRGLDWFGTVRGRVGYLYTSTMLTYATGGLVYGRARNDLTQVVTGAIGPATSVVTAPSISTGWTFGGGIEWALDRKWSVKLEYDYLEFNDGVTVLNFLPGGLKAATAFAHLPDSNINTVQLGLNYHFWN